MVRSEGKFNSTHSLKEMYDKYKDLGGSLDKNKFNGILKKLNLSLIDDILLKGDDLNLLGLGSIEIRKKKQVLTYDKNGKPAFNYMAVDFKKTKELWSKKYKGLSPSEVKEKYPDRPLVYHTNEHSAGFKYRIYWNKDSSDLFNRKIYAFNPNRLNLKRKLSKLIKLNKIEVLERWH